MIPQGVQHLREISGRSFSGPRRTSVCLEETTYVLEVQPGSKEGVPSAAICEMLYIVEPALETFQQLVSPPPDLSTCTASSLGQGHGTV